MTHGKSQDGRRFHSNQEAIIFLKMKFADNFLFLASVPNMNHVACFFSLGHPNRKCFTLSTLENHNLKFSLPLVRTSDSKSLQQNILGLN